jgi:hypothetical protein
MLMGPYPLAFKGKRFGCFNCMGPLEWFNYADARTIGDPVLDDYISQQLSGWTRRRKIWICVGCYLFGYGGPPVPATPAELFR